MDNATAASFPVGYGNDLGHSGLTQTLPAPASDLVAGFGSFTYTAPPAAPATSSSFGSDPTVEIPVAELDAAWADPASDEQPPATDPRRRRTGLVLAFAFLAFLVLAGAVAAVLLSRAPTTVATRSTAGVSSADRFDEHGNIVGAAVIAPTSTAPLTTGAPSPAPVTLPAAPTTAAPTTAPPTTTPPTTPPTTAPALTITAFTTPATVSCANPLDQTPYLPISWTVQHAVKVTISIDGPGIYTSHTGESGAGTFPFACAGPHTYLLTAYDAANHTVTKTVTIHHS